MQKRISVVIPSYNAAPYLGEAIESVLAQGRDDVEIIVVNDGSTDNTAEVARKYGDRIVYIEQDNQGVAGARNTGILAAQGDYIALLDADDAYYPGALDNMAGYLDQHPDIGLVCGDLMMFDETGDLHLASASGGKPQNPANFRWEVATYNLNNSAVMVRREAFDKVGLFEPRLRIGEDWMMWVVMARRYNMAYIDAPLARYRLHGKNVSARQAEMDASNRLASKLVVESPYFHEYPPHFRAKLLYFRFATAWHSEPKPKAFSYLLRALWTDPRQIGYLKKILRDALHNRRAGQSDHSVDHHA